MQKQVDEKTKQLTSREVHNEFKKINTLFSEKVNEALRMDAIKIGEYAHNILLEYFDRMPEGSKSIKKWNKMATIILLHWLENPHITQGKNAEAKAACLGIRHILLYNIRQEYFTRRLSRLDLIDVGDAVINSAGKKIAVVENNDFINQTTCDIKESEIVLVFKFIQNYIQTLSKPEVRDTINGEKIDYEDLHKLFIKLYKKLGQKKYRSYNYMADASFVIPSVFVGIATIMQNKPNTTWKDVFELSEEFMLHFMRKDLKEYILLFLRDPSLPISIPEYTKRKAMEFALKPEKFRQILKEEQKTAEVKAKEFFELLHKEEEERVATSKEIEKARPLNTNAASASSISETSTTPKTHRSDENADKYLSNIIEDCSITKQISDFIESRNNGMITKGKILNNIVGIEKDGMRIIANLNHERPIIYVFNKEKIGISNTLLDKLTSKEIDYYGEGESGTKILKNRKDQSIEEIHLKYYSEGESFRIPQTYKTTIKIEPQETESLSYEAETASASSAQEETECDVIYFDCLTTAATWHGQMFNIGQHSSAPAELSSIIQQQSKDVEQKQSNRKSKPTKVAQPQTMK